MNTYWVSFTEGKNLGCCIIDAEDEEKALTKINDLKINPGGEVMLFIMSNDEVALKEIDKWGKNKLISPEDLLNDGYRKLGELNEEELNDAKHASTVICTCCNTPNL